MNNGCVSCIYTQLAVEAVMVAVFRGPGALKAGKKYQGDCSEGGSKKATTAEAIWEATPGHPMLQMAPQRHDAPHTAAHAGRRFTCMQIADSVAIWLQVLQTGVISATVLLIAPHTQGSLSVTVSQLVDFKTFEMAAER
ncbi:hypothetical protein FB451DRAFT_1176764 [Mycena latifolia]|nr:hypothetical protein FB451DRAFT_1176764 [Mycena latifolia]